MPSHPRVEEVEDSDVEMSDPSEADIDDFADGDIMRQVKATAPTSAVTSQGGRGTASTAAQQQNIFAQAPIPAASQPPKYADFQCLYPVYFDATRSRAKGRRVAKALAVKNPLAMEIMKACEALGLPTVLEPMKQHPKDWGNPGRVKVALKKVREARAARGPTAGGAANVNNKHHLFLLVAKHLQAHPTTEDSTWLRYQIRGAPPVPPFEADKPWPRPAVPRGWKVAELVPYYSPALTGGGVSENLLQDMMKEIQGGGDMASVLAGSAGPSGVDENGIAFGPDRKKKDKKRKAN